MIGYISLCRSKVPDEKLKMEGLEEVLLALSPLVVRLIRIFSHHSLET
jgi:hypothetical protein